jgi:hypothetical protein
MDHKPDRQKNLSFHIIYEFHNKAHYVGLVLSMVEKPIQKCTSKMDSLLLCFLVVSYSSSRDESSIVKALSTVDVATLQEDRW